MGFWDGRLADLEALGIRFDPLLEKALEGEGDVLHLYHVLSPFSHPEYQEGCFDQQGQPVFLIEQIHALRPTGITPSGNSVLSEARENYGDDWEHYPCVLGYLRNEDRYNPYIYYGWNAQRAEQVAPYPFWMCYPFDPKVYKALSRACDQRLQDAFFYEVDEMTSFEYSDDFWVDTASLWLFTYDSSLLTESETEYIKDWQRNRYDADQDYSSVLRAYETLVQAGIVPPPWPEEAKNWVFPGLPFKPMEHYLQTEPLALSIWKIMLAQRSYATARLGSVLPPGEAAAIHSYEEFI